MFGYKPTPIQREGNRFVRSLGNRLATGVEPACLLIQGDSTANETTEWFYLTMQWLASKYPAYTCDYRLWDDAIQSYNGYSTPIQVGTNGLGYASFPGGVGNYVSTPDASVLDIVGDLDIACRVAFDDWTPASTMALIAKSGTEGQKGFTFVVNSTGNLYLYWSADGVALSNEVVSSAIPTITDGHPLWVRATLDVDDGAGNNVVKFYTSSDGINWTQLGNTRTRVGTTSIFNSNAPMTIGAVATSMIFKGKVYSAIVRNGINGTVVASPDFGLAFPAGTVTFSDIQGNVWTVNGTVTVGNGSPSLLLLNSSVSGKEITYSTDATRFALQTAHEPQLAFINYGHNDGASVATYQAIYEGLCTQLLTKWPNVGVVGVTQNPQISPRTAANISTHAKVHRQVAQAMAKNNYGLIDAYKAFMGTGDHASYINSSDGVHPNANGSLLWANEAIKFLQPAVA